MVVIIAVVVVIVIIVVVVVVVVVIVLVVVVIVLAVIVGTQEQSVFRNSGLVASLGIEMQIDAMDPKHDTKWSLLVTM